MSLTIRGFVLLILVFGAVGCEEKADDEIKQKLIRESIARYSGSCPCPYSTARAGRRCGERSAYSRTGGSEPLCYESDVSQEMVDEERLDEQSAGAAE